MQLQQARPPYVRFERRPMAKRRPGPPDGDGGLYYEEVDLALITQIGSKDVHEKLAKDWLADMEKRADLNDPMLPNMGMPSEWVANYRRQYDKWKAGEEIPLDGTPIRTWPVATASEIKICVAVGVLTLEDLAAANEELIQRLGMGGRSLKQRAADYLMAKQDTAPLVERLDALDASNRAMVDLIKKLQEENTGLKGALNFREQNSPQMSLPSLESRLQDAQGDPDKELDEITKDL